MLNWLSDLLYSQLSRKKFDSDHEKQLYLMQMVATLFAAIIHILALIFFIYINIPSFIVYNIISIAFYLFSIILIEKGKYAITGLLLTAEVILYTTTSIYLFGAGNFILMYFFITLAMQIVVQYTAARLRYAIVFVLWGLIISTVVFPFYGTPSIPIGANLAYSMLNINMGVLGIVALLALNNLVSRLISQHNKKQLERFRSEAHVDALTGLFNRRYAQNIFDRIKNGELGTVWCVAMLDIDDFKDINDTYGHEAGDKVLVSLAQNISHHLRKTDMVFRWGGEEFLILLEEATVENAHFILEKLRLALSEMQVLTQEGVLLSLTVTIGVAALNPTNIEESISECDKKLYKGKNSGKNMVVA